MESDGLQTLESAEHGQCGDVAVAAREFFALPDLAEDVIDDVAAERASSLLGGRGEPDRLTGHLG